MSPTTLILLGGLFSGLKEVVSKKISRSDHSSDGYATATLVISAVTSLPFLLYQFSLPSTILAWIISAASAISFALSTAFGFAAYKRADISTVSLIQRLNMVLIFILGIIFLEETATNRNWVGLGLITLGSIIVAKRSSGESNIKGIIYALLMALFGAFAAIFDKIVLQDVSPYTYVFLNNFLVALVFLPKTGNMAQAKRVIKTHPRAVIVRAILANLSFILVLLALKNGAISSVIPTYKSISLFTPVVIGVFLLKETASLGQKITGLAVSITGIYLMY